MRVGRNESGLLRREVIEEDIRAEVEIIGDQIAGVGHKSELGSIWRKDRRVAVAALTFAARTVGDTEDLTSLEILDKAVGLAMEVVIVRQIGGAPRISSKNSVREKRDVVADLVTRRSSRVRGDQ